MVYTGMPFDVLYVRMPRRVTQDKYTVLFLNLIKLP